MLGFSRTDPSRTQRSQTCRSGPTLGRPSSRRTQAAGSLMSSACLSGFGIASPAQVRHRTSFGSCEQCQHTATRNSWSELHMHHGVSRVRCDITKDRAGQLGMCGAALLRLQDHRVLCLDCSHAAWAVSWRLLCVTGMGYSMPSCSEFPTSPVMQCPRGSQGS